MEDATKHGELFERLYTSEAGLSPEEAGRRLSVYGLNELREKHKITPAGIFFRQLGNFIIWVLAAAALISLYIHETVNFWVISFIIIFVLLLGFAQEYRAEKAMDSLRKIMKPRTLVLREGKLLETLTREVVPGDVLVLENGDLVPADACVFEAKGLKVDESSLTGESVPVEKAVDEMIYSGTQVVGGKGRAVVEATGMDTRLGNIADLIQPSGEETPLQKNIGDLARSLAIIALIASGFTFILGVFTGAPAADMLIIALALAVAAVPEGLPLTLTITLAYGMRRMAEHKAIVRKMLAVESLGSTSVICTDKTGTLTKNEMTVERIFTGGSMIEVTGSGYAPEGSFLSGGSPVDVTEFPELALLLKAAALCNNSFLSGNDGDWKGVGDPTEIALITAAQKAGLSKAELESEFVRTDEIMFTSERKLMTTIHASPEGNIAFTKGACEIVLDRCTGIVEGGVVRPLTPDDTERILSENDLLAGNAYRVLAVAFRELPDDHSMQVEQDLVFAGLVAMIDPVRPGVPDAVSLCKEAGIRVVMITGDNEKTARAIASRVGIETTYAENGHVLSSELETIVRDGAITGEELSSLDDASFESVVEQIQIYARVMPEQKLRIVRALRKKGHVVAMTGDGVNDAPALKTADIGISMGLQGTDVARESSVMVLQDDNFSTIVEAVKRGRSIYDNIEKFTSYLVSRNFTEVILILLGISLLGFDLIPLLALQILFINMFDEIMPAIALGLDPVSSDVMQRRPRQTGEQILGGRRLGFVVSVALLMGFACFGVYLFADPFSDVTYARTVTFASIVSMILFVPFAFRSLREPITKTGITGNRLMPAGVAVTFLLTLAVMYIPFIARLFELVPLQATGWIVPVFVSFGVLAGIEVLKAGFFRNAD